MMFKRKDGCYGVTLFTGSNYITLWLVLVDSEPDPAPDVVQMQDPRCPDLNPEEVRAAVLVGVGEANARFGTRLYPLEIRFVMERPSLYLLQTAAFKIVERLAVVGDAGYLPPVVETKHGTVTALVHGFHVKVRLDHGEEVDAVLRKQVVRMAFSVHPGDEVDVVLREPPKMSRVVRLWRAGRLIGWTEASR